MPPPSPDQVIESLRALRRADLPTHGASVLAYVYDSGLGWLDDLAAAAQAEFQWTNALDPTAFPSVATLENDLVAAAAALLGGDERTVGTFTSGGTESCLLAVLSARDRWAERRAAAPDEGVTGVTGVTGGDAGVAGRGTARPAIVLPVTAHAAFRKAAHLFGLDVVDVPVDPVTCAVRAADVEATITDDTALVVVSAPSYPHGVLDPVARVAEACAARAVACHVDACVGGWVLAFLPDVPPFDLSVPGVTSLSVDLHKYGYAPKGASLLLARDPDVRRAHYFVSAAWPGYPVVNPTLAGTRPAGPLAAAWAVWQVLGADGYRALALAARDATVALADGIAAIDGVRVLGAPASTLVAFAAAPGGPDVLVVADEMRARGWVLQPQPAHGDLPPTVHLTVTAASAPRVDALLADLRASVEAARLLPAATPDPQLVEAARHVDVGALTPEIVTGLLQLAGLGADGALPERMAPVHALLGVLPPALAERLLAEIISRVYTS